MEEKKYHMLGGDGKEYGPVSAGELREWKAAGRLIESTPVRREDETQWKTWADYPELAGEAAPPPLPQTPPPGSSAFRMAPALQPGDYQVDVFACLGRAWNLLTANLGQMVLAYLVFVLAYAVLQAPSIMGSLLTAAAEGLSGGGERTGLYVAGILLQFTSSVLSVIFSGALLGGLYIYYLGLIRNRPASKNEVAGQVRACLGQLILASIATSLLTMLGLVFCLLPGIYLAVGYSFAVPLVIDRGMGFWEAMETSRQTVTRHWFIIFFLLLASGIAGCLGVLACGAGIFFTMPVCFAAILYAYEDIFGGQTS